MIHTGLYIYIYTYIYYILICHEFTTLLQSILGVTQNTAGFSEFRAGEKKVSVKKSLPTSSGLVSNPQWFSDGSSQVMSPSDPT